MYCGQGKHIHHNSAQQLLAGGKRRYRIAKKVTELCKIVFKFEPLSVFIKENCYGW